MLVVNDEDEELTWKSYPRLLNTGFAWDMSILSQEDTFGGLPCLIDKEWSES